MQMDKQTATTSYLTDNDFKITSSQNYSFLNPENPLVRWQLIFRKEPLQPG
jgi:hypothetical protein